MPHETIGDVETVQTADHPARTDSPEYVQNRKWLINETADGCYVCSGPVDLSHPDPPDSGPGKYQDHHGGGIFLYQDGKPPILVGFNLFGLEWSLGFAANPVKVQAFVTQINEVIRRLGGIPYEAQIATTDDVMAWVDSNSNANVKMCAVHHIAHEDKHTPDVNGHEGVGIHNGPVTVWLGQATCDWANFDMWGGSTGTIAVAPNAGKPGVQVMHVSPLHPDKLLFAEHRATLAAGEAHILPAHHIHSRLAYAGAHVDKVAI